jgi:hypothetical protein
MAILLDLNNQVFQDQWFRLESIQSRRAADSSKLYSIRITKKIRAVAKRSGEFPEFPTLHADHDSAY